MTIDELIKEAHATACEKGWWNKARTFAEQIALMHSELSEALEEQRVHGLEDTMFIYANRKIDGPAGASGTQVVSDLLPTDKPEGIASELADVLIRIFDTCGRYDIPLEKALQLKMAFNKTRAHRHGGKLA